MLQGMIQNFVRSTLSLTFVIAAARVVFNIKARMARETSWQLELKGDLTKQRRVEAVDKLLSVMTLLVSLVFGLQAIGLDGEQQLHHTSSHIACMSPDALPEYWPVLQCMQAAPEQVSKSLLVPAFIFVFPPSLVHSSNGPGI